ncbi:carbon-nitrogen hydrolase [Chytridium lagenaria]|nr:carbon-nitrogen hydrolase [Chytridium lagenaria]
MKVACLQFAPILGDVVNNQKKCTTMLNQRLKQGDIDLLILPEMAFSGYVFESKDDIRPYIEHPVHGPSITWAKNTAQSLHCFVQLGFPRSEAKNLNDNDDEDDEEMWFNSVVLVNRSGEIVEIYDKHFLYTTDENWAQEGQGFRSVAIKGLEMDMEVKLGFGICMDLNPHRFQSPFTAYEFANFHLRQKTTFVAGSMAWLLSEDGMDEYVSPSDPSMNTLEYWVLRLSPLKHASKGTKIVVAICNRIGLEKGSRFCGSSAIIEFVDGEIEVSRVAGFNNECIIVADVGLVR